jgi:hypothetical protein
VLPPQYSLPHQLLLLPLAMLVVVVVVLLLDLPLIRYNERV